MRFFTFASGMSMSKPIISMPRFKYLASQNLSSWTTTVVVQWPALKSAKKRAELVILSSESIEIYMIKRND